MAEPLKAMYNQSFIKKFGELVQSGWVDFDRERFTMLVMDEGWDQLELKGPHPENYRIAWQDAAG